MIIAIDGYEANVEKRVGIGRYAYEMVRNLYTLGQKAINNKQNLQFRIYVPGKPRQDMPKETYWWQYRTLRPTTLWTFGSLPMHLFIDRPKADVVFSPTHYIPRFTAIPRVMAIMDLSYLSYPELFRAKDLHQLVYWTKYAARHARKIVTISEFSKNAIIKAYKRASDDVIVTHPGLVMTKNDPNTAKRDITEKYRLSNPYILTVGTIQPRKNYARLIEAFAGFLKKNTEKLGDIDLVIVGKKGWMYEEILKAPQKYGVERRVKFLNFVPDSDLPLLYSHALCFVLPSLYEGFGLPVLEAMAQSCPVVISNSSSLPEIAGGAGVYVDPENTESISDGLFTAIKERGTDKGKERVQKGLEQLKKFTWQHAAEETLKVLEQVAGS